MMKELRTSYWKKVSGDKEFIDIENQLMTALPGCFNEENPEIVCIRIGDPIFGDSAVKGLVVTTWVRTNPEYVKNKIEEIVGSLEDMENMTK